jgi:hypothetical protein
LASEKEETAAAAGAPAVLARPPRDLSSFFSRPAPSQNPNPIPPKTTAYPPLSPDFVQADLESTLNYYAEELGFLGVDLRKLVNDQGKKLVISEWGVGGGVEQGDKIATSLERVAKQPFFGLWYPYQSDKDPWTNPDYAAFRRKLYKATADWLKSRGGPTLRVDGIYMWNAGSWDATGVNPTSGGNWVDPAIQSLVRAHNAQVNSV